MEITMHELLGFIKDNIQPEFVMLDNNIYEYCSDGYYCEKFGSLMFDIKDTNFLLMLNDKIKILDKRDLYDEILKLNKENELLKDKLKEFGDKFKQLKKENKKLKKNLFSPEMIGSACTKCVEKNCINYSSDVYKLKNIIIELEKWLEEQKSTKTNENYIVIRLADIKNKLRELKGGTNVLYK